MAGAMKRNTGQDLELVKQWRPATQMVRGCTMRTEVGETSEAIFMTSGYCYDNAEEAAARFRGERPGMTYSRLQNPTVEMLEKRIALIEGAEAARATATGMAAMSGMLLSTLSAGDHLVAGRALFGSCRVLVDLLAQRLAYLPQQLQAAR
jgi:O-acetylhomoserine/O-acetylserine sulfhydrylase-like pyridoxal-dependent enzyme